MNGSDWNAAYNLMRDAYADMVTNLRHEDMVGMAYLENYPPRIEIHIDQIVPDSGRDSRKNLEKAADMVVEMCSATLENHSWLKGNVRTIWKSYKNGRWEIIYTLKPRSYSDMPGLHGK